MSICKFNTVYKNKFATLEIISDKLRNKMNNCKYLCKTELKNFYVTSNDFNQDRHIFKFNNGGTQVNYKNHTKSILHPAHPVHPAHSINIDADDNLNFNIIK